MTTIRILTLTNSADRSDFTAPTGSGKTVLFELAIIKMLTQSGSGPRSGKCIYVAPTKVSLLHVAQLRPLV